MEMTTAWLALLLIAPQDDPKADDAAARARHAVVDRIMAEPAPPKPARPVHVEVVARERVERQRAGFEAVRGDPDAGRDFLERLHPLAVECKQGPFDADSLFAKALRRIEAEGDR